MLAGADFVGSTSGMIRHVGEVKPPRVVMITECSMSDNVAVEFPDVEFIRPCALCPHMKRITLPKILRSLETMEYRVEVDPEVAARARRAVERMLEVKLAEDGVTAIDELVAADVVVVGAGVAGLTAALGLAPRRVVLLTKARLGSGRRQRLGPGRSRGGDGPRRRRPGCTPPTRCRRRRGIADPEVVELLTREGPLQIERLHRARGALRPRRRRRPGVRPRGAPMASGASCTPKATPPAPRWCGR